MTTTDTEGSGEQNGRFSSILMTAADKPVRWTLAMTLFSLTVSVGMRFIIHSLDSDYTVGIIAPLTIAPLVSITLLSIARKLKRINDQLVKKEAQLATALESARAAEREAQMANNAKSDFLANMSHEIRTPLNGLFGSLQIIQQNEEDPAAVHKYSAIAMNSYHAVLGIVNDILDMTKITEGKVELYPEPARLGDILGNVYSDFSGIAREKGLQFELHISEGAKQHNRMIDSLRLGQVLRNLISNALKFTDQGKVEVLVEVGQRSDQIAIVVRDSGPGIDEAKIETIFEAFEQAQASRTTERRGTGLGLSIAKRLVELMNGRIDVASKLGEGSTFTVSVELPVTHEPVKQDIEEQIIDINPARILLAEDVKTNQIVFEVMLRDGPYEIDIADNGEIAVEKALSADYDLIFMDIMMPKMGGVEALQALKIAGYNKPVIACTANVMKEDVKTYLEEGFKSVVGKPYLREDLVTQIQAAVSRATSTDRAK